MITIKDLAPLDDMQLESWRNALKNFDKETMKDLYMFSVKISLFGHVAIII